MIPTVKEFLEGRQWKNGMNLQEKIEESMIAFAKLHVEAFRQDLIDNHVEAWDDCNVTPTTAILNAYPLTNIK